MELGPLQKKWIEELRSGKHIQGQECLCRDDQGVKGYCCLGVAAEFVLGIKPELNEKKYGSQLLYNGLVDCLEKKSRETLGLSEDGQERCIQLNDTKCLSFDEIADRIERNPSKFFSESK